MKRSGIMRRLSREALPLGLRPLVRRLAVAMFGVLRVLRTPRIARGKLPTSREKIESLQQRLGDAVDLSASFTVDAQLPPLNVAYASGPRVAPRPVDTFALIVDARQPGFSFRNNLILGPGGYVLTEDQIRWGVLEVSRSFLEPTKRVKGTVAYLSNTDVANIGHWLCFTLPLVGIYRERLGVEPDYYYIGGPLRSFHVETLAMLGIRREQILTHGVTGDRMIAAIVNRNGGAVDAGMLGYVRGQIAMSHPRAIPMRRLYVARGNVTFRRMINEDQCFALLQQRYGFEYVTMDGMSVAEQVALFASAEAVVAPHGAALTHLLWVPSGTKVLDLFSSEWQHPMFMEIAALVGCDYAYIFGRPSGRFSRGSGQKREDNLRRRADVLVDADEVDRAVAALGVRPVTATDAPTVRSDATALVRRCRSCGSPSLHPFLSLGMAPIATHLITEDELADLEAMFPLGVALCGECALVQLFYEPPLDATVKRETGEAGDGSLLQAFAERGVRVLDIDSSFDAGRVLRLRDDGERADVVVVNDMLADVHDLNGVVEGLAALLAEDGVIIGESTYVTDIIEQAEFDTIHHEHLSYFSCTAIQNLMRRHGLHLNRVEHLSGQRGTVRWTVGRRHEPDGSVREFLDRERNTGLHTAAYYADFGMRVIALQKELLDLLYELRQQGARIVAYGAQAGGATLLNTSRVPYGLLDYVVDNAPRKHGMFMPGTHLPIRHPQAITDHAPDYVLLLDRDRADAIIDELGDYRRRGGRFIVPLPKPQIVS